MIRFNGKVNDRSNFSRCLQVLSVVFLIFVITLGCGGEVEKKKPMQSREIREISDSVWQKLAGKKIFFGHKSVGWNILAGVEDLIRENPQIKLNLIETKKLADFDRPVFAHAMVGRNFDPKSKLNEFSELMNTGIGAKVDFAFLKFCFVDFLPGADPTEVFTTYKHSMNSLKERFPGVTFIHWTVPLTSDEKGVKFLVKKGKDLLKKIIGRTNVYDNTQRNIYNEMLRKEYGGKEPLFDLAEIEATYPDGRTLVVTREGKKYYALVPEYAFEGAHLNESGRKRVAEALLVFLAKQVQKAEAPS